MAEFEADDLLFLGRCLILSWERFRKNTTLSSQKHFASHLVQCARDFADVSLLLLLEC